MGKKKGKKKTKGEKLCVCVYVCVCACVCVVMLEFLLISWFDTLMKLTPSWWRCQRTGESCNRLMEEIIPLMYCSVEEWVQSVVGSTSDCSKVIPWVCLDLVWCSSSEDLEKKIKSETELTASVLKKRSKNTQEIKRTLFDWTKQQNEQIFVEVLFFKLHTT